MRNHPNLIVSGIFVRSVNPMYLASFLNFVFTNDAGCISKKIQNTKFTKQKKKYYIIDNFD